MPAYVTSPFKPVPALLIAGIPYYVSGSFDDKSAPTQGFVISDSSVTTTGTLTYMTTQGNVPLVGDLITVVGTSNDSGHFNVTNASILTVSAGVDASGVQNGVVTVTFTKTSGTVASGTADAGQVIIPRSEIGEALVNNTATVPVAVPSTQLMANQSKTVNATVRFTGSPTTATAYLQGSIFDIDSEYEDIGVITNSGSPGTGPTLEVADSAYRFYRVRYANVTGGVNNKVVAKITC
jgi:hypothetical protein